MTGEDSRLLAGRLCNEPRSDTLDSGTPGAAGFMYELEALGELREALFAQQMTPWNSNPSHRLQERQSGQGTWSI